jgi:hypothetical protein
VEEFGCYEMFFRRDMSSTLDDNDDEYTAIWPEIFWADVSSHEEGGEVARVLFFFKYTPLFECSEPKKGRA